MKVSSINTYSYAQPRFGSITYKSGAFTSKDAIQGAIRQLHQQADIYANEDPQVGLRGLLKMGLDRKRKDDDEEDYPMKLTVKNSEVAKLEIPAIDFVAYNPASASFYGEDGPRTSLDQISDFFMYPYEKDNRPIFVLDEDNDYFTIKFDKEHPYEIEFSPSNSRGLYEALNAKNNRVFQNQGDNNLVVNWLRAYGY